MARGLNWLPLVLAGVLLAGLLGLAFYARERVGSLLIGVAEQVPPPPDLPSSSTLADELASLPAGEPAAAAGDPDEPRLDLDYPTDRDWVFLEGVMAEGDPQARRSAAKALVVMGRMRGVQPLLSVASEGGPDADLYCLAALDILRLQRSEDALPALLLVMLEEERPPSQACRSEVADRFAVAGGRDVEKVAAMAGDADPRVRAFVAGFLSDVDPQGHQETLLGLAEDPVAAVRERAQPSAAARP